MNRCLKHVLTFLSGLTNGLFGSGGGILIVDYLKKEGLQQKNAQATALCATVILSLISTVYYLYNSYFDLSLAFLYIPFGIPGAITGSYLLKKLPDELLRKTFAVFIIYAGIRMIIR